MTEQLQSFKCTKCKSCGDFQNDKEAWMNGWTFLKFEKTASKSAWLCDKCEDYKEIIQILDIP